MHVCKQTETEKVIRFVAARAGLLPLVERRANDWSTRVVIADNATGIERSASKAIIRSLAAPRKKKRHQHQRRDDNVLALGIPAVNENGARLGERTVLRTIRQFDSSMHFVG